MTKFRWHSATLAESMAAVVEVSSFKQLERMVVERFRGPMCSNRRNVVEVKPYCFDERIGWNTHLVTLDGMAVGYTDGSLA